MKNLQLKLQFMLLALFFSAMQSSALDFEVNGIYYKTKGDSEVEVTCPPSSLDDYSGEVDIPELVEYNGKSYLVTSIGRSAFEHSDISNIIIPNTVTTIGDNAFSRCTGLTSVIVPKNITNMGSYAFFKCTSIKKVTWEAIACNKGMGLTDGTPYDTSNLEEIIIGNEVEVIPDEFISSSSVKSVAIPKSVKIIGRSAFHWCRDLENIDLGETSIIGDNAFLDCSSLNEIIIPNTVTDIGKDAFRGCSNLTSLIIGNSVTKIGNSAFSRCGLTNVIVPNSVTSFGEYVFSSCTSLETFTIPETFTTYNRAFVGCTSLKSVTIPDSFTAIGMGEFYGCTGLESISIPNTVKSIGCGAFEKCTSLAEVVIPDSVIAIGDSYNSYDGMFTGAFSGCTALKKITIGKSLSGTHSGAFSGCSGITELIWNTRNSCSFLNMPKSNIKKVIIGDEVKELPSNFVKGSQIETILIPNSVSSIGKSAFEDCLQLTSATISNSITILPDLVFANCRKLKKITIPYPVISIGNSAFYYCEDLTDVICLAKTPPAMNDYNGLYPAYQMATLHIPERSVDAYKATDWWNCFLDIKGDANEENPTDDSDYIKCDTNGDGEVNIADVNRVIDAILSH